MLIYCNSRLMFCLAHKNVLLLGNNAKINDLFFLKKTPFGCNNLMKLLYLLMISASMKNHGCNVMIY